MEDATILNIGGIDYRIVDASVPSWAKQNTKPSYAANEISGLATVATSGSYSDLTDTPNIPTILTVPVNSTGSGGNIVYILGNGIQYANITTVLDNGGEVVLKYGNKIYCLSKRENDSLTFSSLQGDDDNYSSFDIDSASRVNYHSGTIITSETTLSKGTPTGSGNAVTDITVSGHQITLTKGTTFLTASDITGKADKSEAIGSLSLSLNTTDYKITLSGTYVDGTPFIVSDVIDLPLESVVVGGSYNPSTKKVVLTLKNNSTVEFSIADLISGLQSEITSSNKLSADLVEDGTNNKVFTATEKTKLSGIEAGAEVNVQSDWNQTNTSADDYVKNKPTIPTVGTLNTNNSTAQTVNSSESFSGNISLHKVSKTGSYNDLLNKPEIPEDTHQIVILVDLQETPLVFQDWNGNSLTHEQVAEIFSDPSKTVILYDNSSDVTYRYCGLFEQYYFSFIAPYSGGISYVSLVVENPSTGIIIVRKKGTVNYVPNTRKINNKRLSADITLTASEVGALPANTHIPVDPVNADWNSTGGLSEILNKPTIVQSVSINGGTAVSPNSTNGNVNLEGIITGIYWGQHGIPPLNGIVTIPDNIVYGMLDNGLWYLGSYDTETGNWIYSESGSATGELSKIYVNVAPANKVETYIWTGTKFEEVISTSEYATESYVTNAINALPTPMVFQGTIGTGGTSTTVPSNPTEGDTYKIISGGQSLTFSGITGTIRVGDIVIYKNSTVGWVLIPSGDDPSGTVTSVNMTVPTGLSVSGTPITSSGTLAVSFAAGYSIPTTAKQASWDQKQNAIEIIDLT